MAFPILAVASLASNMMSGASNVSLQKQQLEEQKKQNALQHSREDSAYSRAVIDMKRAGLNPYGNSGLQQMATTQGQVSMPDGSGFQQIGGAFDNLASAEQSEFNRQFQAEQQEDSEVNTAYSKDLDNTSIDVRNALNGLENCTNDFKTLVKETDETTRASAISVKRETERAVENASKRTWTTDEINTINNAYTKLISDENQDNTTETDSTKKSEKSSYGFDGDIAGIIGSALESGDDKQEKQFKWDSANKEDKKKWLKEHGYKQVENDKDPKTGKPYRDRNGNNTHPVEVYRNGNGEQVELRGDKCVKGNEHVERDIKRDKRNKRGKGAFGAGFEEGESKETADIDVKEDKNKHGVDETRKFEQGHSKEDGYTLTKEELYKFSCLTSAYLEYRETKKHGVSKEFYNSYSWKQYQRNYNRYLSEFNYAKSYRDYLRSDDGRTDFFHRYRESINLRHRRQYHK